MIELIGAVASTLMLGSVACGFLVRYGWPISVQMVLLGLAHIYAGGVAFATSLAIFFLKNTLRGTQVIVPPLIASIWGVWLVAASFSVILNDASLRHIIQFLEFIFYGIVATSVYNYCVSIPGGVYKILISSVIGSVLLACLFILARFLNLQGWPDSIMGRNEGAFFITCLGIIPSFYLIASAASDRREYLQWIIVVFLFSVILFVTESRAGIVASFVLSIAFYLLRGRISLRSCILFFALFCASIYFLDQINHFINSITDITRHKSNLERLNT